MTTSAPHAVPFHRMGWAAVGASQMRQLGKIAVSLGQVISSYARVYMIPWPESFNVMFNGPCVIPVIPVRVALEPRMTRIAIGSCGVR
jgi:hypothetical protein